MTFTTTAAALSKITDSGLFERLATDILREAEPNCRYLAHTGVNVAGKTIKAPVDCICFVPEEDPLHLIVVHHTIGAKDGLHKKWLHDPETVVPKKSKKNSSTDGAAKETAKAPPGDLLKTAKFVSELRKEIPTLRVTLILTTNEEPDPGVIATVTTAALVNNIAVKFWTRSLLCDFLDSKPTGQWLRYQHLGIAQEQLSRELLLDLSSQSLKLLQGRILDNPTGWIARDLDLILATNLRHTVTFLVASSGLGKTVACLKYLKKNRENGRISLVLDQEVISSSSTIEQAVMATLLALHPSLAGPTPEVFSFASPEEPMLLLVEDINRSGITKNLTEKLIAWNFSNVQSGDPQPWRLLCPLWPEALSSLEVQARKRIDPLVLTHSGFTPAEGVSAIENRTNPAERKISGLEAAHISTTLGHDPLLIALHDPDQSPDPQQTLGHFVENTLQRIASTTQDFTAADFREANRALAAEMLRRRQLEPKWNELRSQLSEQQRNCIGRISKDGTLLRMVNSSASQQIIFRHDRVRDWLLVDAVGYLEETGLLTDEIIADPFFSEILGTALITHPVESQLMSRLRELNPLALFHSLRLPEARSGPQREKLLVAINSWLDKPTINWRANASLRWNALAMLGETEDPEVPKLVAKVNPKTIHSDLALLRNGDPMGGIRLCQQLDPSVPAPWRDSLIEHAKFRYGSSFLEKLGIILRQPDLHQDLRTGALRLAGHLADQSLVHSIKESWMNDSDREAQIDLYIWAFGQCCWNNSSDYLEPIFDLWSTLSDQSKSESGVSPRLEVTSNGLDSAFQFKTPLATIDFLCLQGSREDLRWPIVCLLDHVDHPKALSFIIGQIAAERRTSTPTSFPQISMRARENWESSQKYYEPMSELSRDFLLHSWRSDVADYDIRFAAFSLWSATHKPGDLEKLIDFEPTPEFDDLILKARLRRGDLTAIPLVIGKLAGSEAESWWWLCRYVWSPEITETLDKFIGNRAASFAGTGSYLETFVCELIQRLPPQVAESILIKHWPHVKNSTRFILTALYVATDATASIAKEAISQIREPSKIFEHFSFIYPLLVENHPGLTRHSQVLTLVPYFHLIEASDLERLWGACNRGGWYALRREQLDPLLCASPPKALWSDERAAAALDEMVRTGNLRWLDHWLDDFLSAGTAWSEIRQLLFSWLAQRQSIQALEAVCAALRVSRFLLKSRRQVELMRLSIPSTLQQD
jgi:hypothetical protein